MNWKKWFKSNDDIQECLIIRGDSRIVEVGCNINKDWMLREGDDTTEAYVLDAENMIKRRSDNVNVQVLSESDVVPVPIRGIKNREFGRAQMNKAGQLIVSQTILKVEKQNAKDQLVRNLTLLVAIPCLTVLIIVAVNLWQGRSIMP